MTQTSKTEAKKIARHLVGDVHVVAASLQSGRTWGYSAARGERQYTTVSCGSYRDAQRQRASEIAEIVETLVDGEDEMGRPAPAWMSLEFVW